MSKKHSERIPAEEVENPKRWSLPFWTEPEHVIRQESDGEEVVIEEEEIEIEPLTAEQLESIRQEAYNEGLNQGLIEGRQKGEKQGYDDGYQKGIDDGKTEGHKVGFSSGEEEGKNQAIKEGKARTDERVQALNNLLEELLNPLENQQAELVELLHHLALNIAQVVIKEELSQGSEHIVNLSKLAIDALPIGENNIKLTLSQEDLPYVEAAIEQLDISWVLRSDETIEPGGCRVESDNSLVDFTLSTRWSQVAEDYRRQLMHIQLENKKQESDVNEKLDFLSSQSQDDIAENINNNESYNNEDLHSEDASLERRNTSSTLERNNLESSNEMQNDKTNVARERAIEDTDDDSTNT